MDSRFQGLKRRAKYDSEARAKLAANSRRLLGECPEILPKARNRGHRAWREVGYSFSGVQRNRNEQRLFAHKQNKCGAKCRFCRRYGPYKL